jgi:hypothetical protein
MNLIIARLWAAEARSGKYTQGRGLLSAGGCHCFNGILCELAVAAGVTTVRRADSKQLDVEAMAYAPADRFGQRAGVGYRSTPYEVLEWAGLSHRSESELSSLNDLPRRLTFNQLADYIDANADQL